MNLFSKRIVVGAVALVVLIVGVILFIGLTGSPEFLEEPIESEEIKSRVEIIGRSVLGRDIEAYRYGTGENHLLFVGGIHGGYEWNSVVLAYEFIDYFNDNPKIIPGDLTVTIIPSLNPDGVYKIIGEEGRFGVALGARVTREAARPGRFNARGVDLNRNFDCKWQPESMWQGQVVSAGTGPFSEPEALALRDFVLKTNPSAVVFWHSRANAVYASECEEGILPETRGIMNAYSRASGYPGIDSFDHYEISGDAEGWLASIDIAAITVELETYDSIEWQKNLRGVRGLFEYYKSTNANI